MKFVDLKKSLSSLSNVYLISGDDRFLCYNALEQIVEAASVNMKDMNMVDMNSPTASDIVASANIYPFGDERRVVVVHDYAPKSGDKEKKEIEAYLLSPMPSTVLIFFNLSDDTFISKFKDKLTYVDCNKLDAGSISKYISKSLESVGVSADQSAINLLALYCLYDMQRISGEINKLTSYLGGEGRLTDDIVKQMVVQDKEYQVFSLAEYISRGDASRALDLVNSLYDKSGGFGLLGALYNNYRRLLYVAVTKASDQELAKALGTKEFAVKMLKNQLGVFSPRKIKTIVDYLGELDSNIKQGKIKEEIAIKTAVVKILKIRNSK